MTTAQALESVLNAWVNGRKVRDGIPLTIRQQAEQALLTADAQATVEALQRERDEAIREHGKESGFWGRTCARLLDKRDKLQTALDAEREKVKGLHEVTKVICAHCCEPMEIPSKAVLQTQLSQLQALVRALPVVESPVKDEDILDNWESDRITFEALRGLLEYRATLDATAPARWTAEEIEQAKREAKELGKAIGWLDSTTLEEAP